MSIRQVQAIDLVQAKLYRDETEVVQDALRHLLQDRPDLRIALAAHFYQTDEEMTLAKAATLAGVSAERMKEILTNRAIPLRLGPATVEDARAEIIAMEQWQDARPR